MSFTISRTGIVVSNTLKNRNVDIVFNEDLYVPGYFEVDIKKGESIVFSAGISEISPRKLKQTFEAEVEDRTPRDSFYHCLQNSPTSSITSRVMIIMYWPDIPGSSVVPATCFVSLPGLNAGSR